MSAVARLSGELLARKGQAMPTGGFASPAIALSQPLPAPDRPGPQAPRGDKRRVALTLRLDRERHRRLRIFAARRACSHQEVILKALDAYLEACGVDCACLRGATPECVTN